MNETMSLDARMKRYELSAHGVLQPRTPVIIRIDGKAFHTYTKGFNRPFSEELHNAMVYTMNMLCENVQNAVFGYTQSDEISILLNDWRKFSTHQWFDGKIQKIASVSASYATGFFNSKIDSKKIAFFDARAFNIPKEEVLNYFLWRGKDCQRNSMNMLARSYFSHNELQGLNVGQVQHKLFQEKGVNWIYLDDWKKNGSARFKIEDEWVGSDIFNAKYAESLFETLLKSEEK